MGQSRLEGILPAPPGQGTSQTHQEDHSLCLPPHSQVQPPKVEPTAGSGLGLKGRQESGRGVSPTCVGLLPHPGGEEKAEGPTGRQAAPHLTRGQGGGSRQQLQRQALGKDPLARGRAEDMLLREVKHGQVVAQPGSALQEPRGRKGQGWGQQAGGTGRAGGPQVRRR